MARKDGLNRAVVRHVKLKAGDVNNTQQHNEREKSSYVNQDIVPERTAMNVHFRTPDGDYQEIFDRLKTDGVISTRGLKADAALYGELVFDVNSAYFFNHGGYEFAKQFYHEAYQAAIEIVGGEQYILSAVMHADERNRAMSEALGQDVYHYHLHVVYIPIVEKQILWSKRCKNKALVGTVKEVVHQVSMSKKWASKPALDRQGTPLLTATGKPVLKKSYSVLQDAYYEHMRTAGYTDVERGERGSTEEHLTVTQFKLAQEQERLSQLTMAVQAKQQSLDQVEKSLDKAEKCLEKAKGKLADTRILGAMYQEIETMGNKTFTGNISFTPQEASKLKTLAREAIGSRSKIGDLKDSLVKAKREADRWKRKYEVLEEKTELFMSAVKRAPQRVMDFLREVMLREPEQPKQTSRHNEKNHNLELS